MNDIYFYMNEDLLWSIFPKTNIFFESPWGYRSLVPPWGHVLCCANASDGIPPRLRLKLRTWPVSRNRFGCATVFTLSEPKRIRNYFYTAGK